MKVTAESKKTFQPIKLTIEIENQSELEWYKALFGVDKNDVENIYFNKGLYPKVRFLTDPDPMGNILDVLDKH